MITTSNDNDVIENNGDETEETTNVEVPKETINTDKKDDKTGEERTKNPYVYMVKRELSADSPPRICVNLL